MQLTRTADYGIRVMIHLASLPAGTRVTWRHLARDADVSPTFMSKILQRLTSARLILSHRGKRGGFELGRPDTQITLLDIVTALEGPLCLNVCLMPGERCQRSPWCGAHVVWAEAQAKLAGVLRGASLESLVRVTRMRREMLGLT